MVHGVKHRLARTLYLDDEWRAKRLGYRIYTRGRYWHNKGTTTTIIDFPNFKYLAKTK